jgi:hypothetical protein
MWYQFGLTQPRLKGTSVDHQSMEPFLPMVLDSSVESSGGKPATNFNTSKTLRIAVVGDVDSNQGLTKQLEIANH